VTDPRPNLEAEMFEGQRTACAVQSREQCAVVNAHQREIVQGLITISNWYVYCPKVWRSGEGLGML
jgi:hypothetical protein